MIVHDEPVQEVEITSPQEADIPVVSEPAQPQEPVDLDADSISHDENTKIITATGNVFLVQSGRILRADEMSYNLATGIAVAKGHVVLNEENGDIYYSEQVELKDKMKDGLTEGLKAYMNDGSRFTADKGKREDGVKTTMEDATYTPCEPCKNNPDASPLWQIRASEVTHDKEEHRITYKNARFEAKGVPVAYIPYFSHADGTIKRKSGFVDPSAGFRSDMGALLTSHYYWDIAPDKDLTVGLTAMTKQAPLLTGEWRQRWANASLEMQGGVTYSERVREENGIDIHEDEEMRGHILGEGLWDINEKWRAGMDLAWASDDQYMRQYDFSNRNVLENDVYAERFSGRDYAVGRVLTFQDIRVLEDRNDQPQVLPEIIAEFTGEPGAVPVIGGRWNAGGSLLGLRRFGSDQDMDRLSFEGGWQRRLVSDYGLLTTVDAGLRSDVYYTRDRFAATAGSGRSTDSTATRLYPLAQVQTSYPLTKPMETMQATIAPVVALAVAPNIDISEKIPNEDSQDVQLDASNIFEANRFPGADRVEDRSHLTYGVRSGLYGYGGSFGEVFLGQSYRLQEDDNPFPEGSGLDRQTSDIVGQVSGTYGDIYNLDYRFQLASKDFSSQRHEVSASANWGRFYLSSQYLFAKSLEGTIIDERREQLQGEAGYYLTEDWRVRAAATQDLGAQPGLRRAMAGIDYFGQCLSWSLTGQRNLTDDASGESDTEIIFSIGLKNLGGFEEPDWHPDDRDK
ncbi:MAG: LPS-assembly protein LptD [Alphaproteobacteria bacterium]|nr:LPS-assembly protein LptD [Alphaproteobacteria bacterium]